VSGQPGPARPSPALAQPAETQSKPRVDPVNGQRLTRTHLPATVNRWTPLVTDSDRSSQSEAATCQAQNKKTFSIFRN